MTLKTYDLTLDGERVISLRLTSAKLAEFCEKHGVEGAAPSVSVLNAVNSQSAKLALLTAALNYPGAPVGQTKNGAELLDTLIDAGYDASDIDGLIAELAIRSGIIPQANAEDLRAAMEVAGSIQVNRLLTLLNGKHLEDAEPEENPQ